jgi:hypothetical protein
VRCVRRTGDGNGVREYGDFGKRPSEVPSIFASRRPFRAKLER